MILTTEKSIMTMTSTVFDQHAHTWWDPKGAFKPLHDLNPCRIDFLLYNLKKIEKLHPVISSSLKGLSILDVGCGGGILSEPLARLGASVTGIDASEASIKAAQSHAREHNTDVTYTTDDVSTMPKNHFDVVIASEVIEHVDDPKAFVADIAACVKPGGYVMMTTLNRTWKSYALGILVAEHILKWAPKGTHEHDKFVRPSELEHYFQSNGLEMLNLQGLVFSPLSWSWSLDNRKAGADLSINYCVFAQKNEFSCNIL